MDRPGEIRAAKAPASKQKSVLADVLSEVGIENIDVMDNAEGEAK